MARKKVTRKHRLFGRDGKQDPKIRTRLDAPKIEERKRLLELMIPNLKNGLSLTKAAVAAGINERTFRVWRSKALAAKDFHNSGYREFFDQLELARAEGCARDTNLARAMIVAKKDAMAMLKFLGLAYPEEYGSRVRLTVDGALAESQMERWFQIILEEAGSEITERIVQRIQLGALESGLEVDDPEGGAEGG